MAAKLGFGSFEGDSVRKPPHHSHAVRSTEPDLRPKLGIPPNRNPKLGRAKRIGKAWWHDAEHAVIDAVQFDRASDDRAIPSELPVPKGERQDDRRLRARPCMVVVEHATCGRRDAQHFEEIPGHLATEHDHGLSVLKQHFLVEPVVVRRHVGETPGALAPVEVVGSGHMRLMPAPLGVFLPNGDEPGRLMKGQWLEHHRVEDGEDRDRSPDTECESQDGDDGKRWLAYFLQKVDFVELVNAEYGFRVRCSLMRNYQLYTLMLRIDRPILRKGLMRSLGASRYCQAVSYLSSHGSPRGEVDGAHAPSGEGDAPKRANQATVRQRRPTKATTSSRIPLPCPLGGSTWPASQTE